MSALDRVREKFKSSSAGTRKSSKSPSAGFAGSQTEGFEKLAPPSAGFAGSLGKNFENRTEVDILELTPLSLAQEAVRRDVRARLAAHPQVQRTFVTRYEGDTLIVTLAVRDIGTCELVISAERMQTPANWANLLRCLDKPGGAA